MIKEEKLPPLKIYQKKAWLEEYNKEPYKSIRQKVLDTFKDLVFIEEGHKYFLGDRELMCVSNMTHQFQEHFDPDVQAPLTYERNYNNPDSKYYHMTVDEIKEAWEKNSKHACQHGTERHEFSESIFHFMVGEYDRILPEFKDRLMKDEEGRDYFLAVKAKEIAAGKVYMDMPDCLIPILAETKVYNIEKEYAYSGTFDILFYYNAQLIGRNPDTSGLYVLDWKGLDVNTPILTTDGWKTMGTVAEGDYVYDENGNATKVVHTSEIHHNPCYEIKFDNNDTIIADEDHRWKVFINKRERIFSTKKLYDFVLTHEGKRTMYNIPKIQNMKGIDTDKTDLLIDPYVLGVWLGDGHSSCGMVTNMYDEIFDEIKKRGFEIGNDVSQGGAGKAKTRTIYKLSGLLRQYGLINNKHIPYEYLISSLEVKKEVLQGLMDTDGYYNPKRKRYVLSTTRIYQVSFCQELLSCLGIKSTLLKYTKKINGKKIECFDVAFWCEFYPFLKREIKVTPPKTDCRSFRNIVSITPVNTIPTRCIEVDSIAHTFCFGKGMIVTHNTNADLFKNFAGKTLLPPFDEMLDMPKSMYILQLNSYQMALEKIGLKVIARKLFWLLPDGTYQKIPLENITKKLNEALKEKGRK